jgi:hypothetical protein
MALILLRMRCSEAEVGRVLSPLRHLLGDHVQHTQENLVEPRLTIMMNNLDVTPDDCEALPDGT